MIGTAVDPLPPVLCFIDGEWPLFSAPDEYAGVRLEGTGLIRKLVAAPPVLDPTLIDRLARLLRAALPAK
jgi:hypothetical protein